MAPPSASPRRRSPDVGAMRHPGCAALIQNRVSRFPSSRLAFDLERFEKNPAHDSENNQQWYKPNVKHSYLTNWFAGMNPTSILSSPIPSSRGSRHLGQAPAERATKLSGNVSLKFILIFNSGMLEPGAPRDFLRTPLSPRLPAPLRQLRNGMIHFNA
jgi:hypothetical protein